MESYELTCPACGQREICRPPQLLERVQSLGMLRRTANPEPAFLLELFHGSLARQTCRGCGHAGLTAGEFVEEQWDEDRLCEVCGKQISAARVAALPATTRCVTCASQGGSAESGNE